MADRSSGLNGIGAHAAAGREAEVVRGGRRPRLNGLGVYAVAYLVFLYLPVAVLPVFSFNDSQYVTFPLKGFTFKWVLRARGQPGAAERVLEQREGRGERVGAEHRPRGLRRQGGDPLPHAGARGADRVHHGAARDPGDHPGHLAAHHLQPGRRGSLARHRRHRPSPAVRSVLDAGADLADGGIRPEHGGGGAGPRGERLGHVLAG